MKKIDTKTIIDFIFFILALIAIFLLCNSNELILLLFLIYLIYGETIAFFQKKIIDEYIDTEIKKRNFEEANRSLDSLTKELKSLIIKNREEEYLKITESEPIMDYKDYIIKITSTRKPKLIKLELIDKSNEKVINKRELNYKKFK